MLIFSPKRIAYYLLAASLILDFLSILTTLPNIIFNRKIIPFTVLELFHVDIEHNFPSFFSALMLALCSLLLWLIAEHKYTRAKGCLTKKVSFLLHWRILSLVFLFLATDESVGLHDKILSFHLEKAFHLGGLFSFAWVIVAIPLCLIFALAYFKFLLHLPDRIKQLFILSGSIYVGAAVGIEMISGAVSEKFGEEGLAYFLPTSIEESLEKIGIVLFIYALLLYIKISDIKIGFQLSEPVKTTN